MDINPMELLKNFQNLQGKLNEMQEKMKSITVTGSAGGGMVQVEMDGSFSVTGVAIAPEVVDPNEREMLQDLVLAAFTDALARVKEKMKDEASSATGGMNLPPGLMGM